MKVIGAALVTIALIAADVIGDLGYMSPHDAHNWEGWDTIGLILFVTLVVFTCGQESKKEEK